VSLDLQKRFVLTKKAANWRPFHIRGYLKAVLANLANSPEPLCDDRPGRVEH
jgi:hypothetical protein